jgi:hypothetical protein
VPVAELLKQLDEQQRKLIAILDKQDADLDEVRRIRDDLERNDREIKQLLRDQRPAGVPKRTRDPKVVDQRLLDLWGAKRDQCGRDYEGRLDVTLTIAASGRATEVQVQGAPRSATVESCFTAAVKTVDFGADVGAVSLQATIAINLDVFAVVDSTPVRPLTAKDIEQKISANRAALRACAGDYKGKLEIRMTIAPSGAVIGVETQPAASPTACVAKAIKRIDFGLSTGGTFGYTLAMEPSTPPVPAKAAECSNKVWVEETETKADAYMGRGTFVPALALYETIVTCKPTVLPKTYLAACRARAFPKAKTYFQRFPAKKQDAMAQICMKEGFDPRS